VTVTPGGGQAVGADHAALEAAGGVALRQRRRGVEQDDEDREACG
jgi:hypothetical protein